MLNEDSIKKIESFRGKWKPYIVFVLLHKKNKFNKIKHSLRSITSRTLSKNLGDLIKAKLIEKNGDVYNLTPIGHKIAMHIEQVFVLIDSINLED